jgi:hypothetical protein
MSQITEQIEKLKLEIKAMQDNPSLRDGTYGKKIKELMKLRRQQTRKGRKTDG